MSYCAQLSAVALKLALHALLQPRKLLRDSTWVWASSTLYLAVSMLRLFLS